jgi:dTDP-4-dehydrorhamnose 3,5-epimerase
MQFETCTIPGLVIVTPKVFQDSRGYFFEAYNRQPFFANGIDADFVQDNQSRSTYGVIRGLHYQRNPFAQAKLVRVLQGVILDVAVDIRKGSPTYGQHFSIELSEENRRQLYIPAGFAHGFSVLSETAIVLYKCDQYYSKDSEGGIRFDDPALGIDWKVETSIAVVSDKDLALPSLEGAHHNFTF